MSSPCPRAHELTRLLDGELTENRAGQLRTHLEACPRCAAELATQERLVSRIAAPISGPVAAGAIEAVMRRIDESPMAAPRQAATRYLPRAMVGLAAAAALAMVVIRPWQGTPGFAARGASVEWTRKIGVELWALEGAPRRLSPGDRLAPGVAVVGSYSNVDPAPAWLLAYAIDERGEVHWLYPGFLKTGTDPQSERLEGSVVHRALQESVVLEDVPDGSLRLITVVTRTPLHVSDIESLRPSDRTPEALRSRWPDARVDELSLRYASPPPAAP